MDFSSGITVVNSVSRRTSVVSGVNHNKRVLLKKKKKIFWRDYFAAVSKLPRMQLGHKKRKSQAFKSGSNQMVGTVNSLYA